jgi:hypothetical protein
MPIFKRASWNRQLVSIGVRLGPPIGVGPSGRTGSGYWIDHLPGVSLLKLDRTDIAES